MSGPRTEALSPALPHCRLNHKSRSSELKPHFRFSILLQRLRKPKETSQWCITKGISEGTVTEPMTSRGQLFWEDLTQGPHPHGAAVSHLQQVGAIWFHSCSLLASLCWPAGPKPPRPVPGLMESRCTGTTQTWMAERSRIGHRGCGGRK